MISLLFQYTKDGNIPLFTAIQSGNHALSRELLNDMAEEQTSYALPSTGETCLHITVTKRDMEILKMLIEFGAKVDAQDVSIRVKFRRIDIMVHGFSALF